MRATRTFVHADKLAHNIEAVRKLSGPERRICFPVKADGYGHGAVWISRFALEAGVSWLAVATVDEAVRLRKADIDAPILLLSIPLPEEIPAIAAHDITPLVGDREFAALLDGEGEKNGKTLSVHLKVDTGMGRTGAAPEDASDLAAFIDSRKWLRLEGTATHLAVSDSLLEDDIAFTRGQIESFRTALDAIRSRGLDPGIVHAANSGAVLLHPEAYFDMVRPGIMLYGYSPLSGKRGSVPAKDAQGTAVVLEPVMEMVSRVVFIKKVKKGETVSYGRTWTAPEDSWIATVPAGYADGIPRSLGGKFSLYIRGGLYPVAGRICMDQCMVNLGPETAVERWDQVTIFGGQGASAADIAKQCGTIPYEILCNINRRVPRVYYR